MFYRGLLRASNEPGESFQIDIASGEDYSDTFAADVEPMSQQCAKRHRGRRLDDDLHSFPYTAHRLYDALFTDGDDIVHKIPHDRERLISQRSEQAVGNRLRVFGRNEFARAKGTVGIICSLGLSRDHLRLGPDVSNGQSRSAGQPASSDWCHNNVQVRDVLQKFKGGRCLSGDNQKIVVGMNGHSARLVDDFRKRFLPRLQ